MQNILQNHFQNLRAKINNSISNNGVVTYLLMVGVPMFIMALFCFLTPSGKEHSTFLIKGVGAVTALHLMHSNYFMRKLEQAMKENDLNKSKQWNRIWMFSFVVSGVVIAVLFNYFS